ncbi:hypothetical protein RFM99_34565 [Mesorhizobium sp. VK4C]|uniref:hypothetical protein n=1 Tax=Mesorhizobium captivum TaxID=3072319 RepID=UPI002A23E98D|nr:hypothetical protein [Mesorhizobium sp. VK4C]MDX8503481.1 hypothetical protein [Mesorhizobium sp. VK4C]
MTALNRVNSPTVDEYDVDYLDQCKFALEPSVRRLAELALAAGWSRPKIGFALMVLAMEMTNCEIGQA